MSSLTALSPGAMAEVENDFNQIEQELRGQAAAQLDGSGSAWRFDRRDGLIVEQLTAVATVIAETHPDENVAIIVGSSSHATHRIIGSVAVRRGPGACPPGARRGNPARRRQTPLAGAYA
jgi:hypothetical protein